MDLSGTEYVDTTLISSSREKYSSERAVQGKDNSDEPGTSCSCFRVFSRFHRLGHNYVLYEREELQDEESFKLIIGPHWQGSIFLLVLLCSVTTVVVAQEQISLSNIFFWIFIALSITTACGIFALMFTDPGIIRISRQKVANTHMCPECELIVPNSAHHCFSCGVCIDEMDHHCIWVGKCIGKKNMFIFKVFNFIWITYMTVVIVQVMVRLF